jgi:RNA polymerase sigma-70 factor (TIGR02960 family)
MWTATAALGSALAESRTSAAATDEQSFAALVEPYRAELHAHCYRMLGSMYDADDALQETLLRAWRGLPRFEGRSSLRSWLYTIATNTSLTQISRRPKRVLPIDYGPAADPHDPPGQPIVETVWIEPYPDEQLGLEGGPASPEASYEQREGIELAFVAALQHLSALQRAALILREVLGFSAAEVAGQLDTSTAAVNSALQRARKVICTTGVSQQSVLRDLGQDSVEEIVNNWMTAWQAGDVDGIVAMLADDARFSMPPLPEWYHGPEAIRAFLIGGPLLSRWRFLPTTANGQLAFGTYLWDDAAGAYMPGGLDVLAIRDGRVAEIVAFLSADLTDFGLPASLPA